MMVPFDGTAPQQQAAQHGSISRPQINHGHHGISPSMMSHGQNLNTGYQHPNMHRQHSGQNFSIPSPTSRQTNFGAMPNGNVHYQNQSQPSHLSMRSPAAHQTQSHHSMPPQMHSQPVQLQHGHQSHPQHMGLGNNSSQHPNMGSGTLQDNRPRNYAGAGANGTWQNETHNLQRRQMIQQIVKLLKKDKNGSDEWLEKLPQMAKHLEVSLYRNARSFEEYIDLGSLKQRLQVVAIEVSRKTKNHNGNDRQRTERNQLFPNNTVQQMQHQDLGRGGSHSAGSQSHPKPPYVDNQGINMASNQQQIMQQQMTSHRQRVNMNDINPMANGTSGVINDKIRGSSNVDFTGSLRNSMLEPNTTRGSSTSSNMDSSAIPHRNDPEWQVRIRHKQQRLLLLHHSAKCPHENGCTVTSHCADMKRLWRHMEACKDNNCRVPHCFSSRTVLSHYRKCRDSQCPACVPVRETVRKTAKSGSMGRLDHRLSGGNNSVQSQSINNFLPDNRIASSTSPQPHISGSASPDPIAPGLLGGNYGPHSMSFQRQQISASQPTTMPPPVSVPPMSNSLQFNSYRPPSQIVNSNPLINHTPVFNSKNEASNRSGNTTPPLSSGDPFLISGSAPLANSSAPRGRDSAEWNKVRHKQQRLLLLRHASRCQSEPGKCTVTQHCASMKELWEHIAKCKNHKCPVQHCMSSRYVLSHYRRCKDARCPACGPVRETVRGDKVSNRNSAENGGSHIGLSSMDLKSMDTRISPLPEAISNDIGTLDEPLQKRQKLDHLVPTQFSSEPINASPTRTNTSASMDAKMHSNANATVHTSFQMEAQVAPGKSNNSKLDDHSLLNSFTIEEIELHLASLHRAVQLSQSQLKIRCGEILKGLQSHDNGWVFNSPVDPEALQLHDYRDLIKEPMDLGTVSQRLESGKYHSIEEFAAEVNLTFDNAMTYNQDGTVVHEMAKELKAKFTADLQKLITQLEVEARQNDRACTLCGCEKLLFEPPVFFCNGLNCQSTRIRRNSHFYVGGNGQYFWCNPCYNELDPNIPIELVDTTVMKNDLKKKKNDEVHEESWVQCDECESWIHQICGLFNTRQNKEHHSKYFCPKCLIKKRKEGMREAPRPPCATELPRTKLSDQLERHVHRRVDERQRKLAQDRADIEKIPFEDALKKLECGLITIRQVTSTDRKLEVRDLMKKRYAHKNYPDEFPYRCKCLVIFQRIDGVDVVLFALYIYEHGPDNPPPNQRCVYISYLDSVHFMRPRRLRTFLYHELLICYLDYARLKGFSTAHIWACPPLKGDDYIFYAKPEDQKTPRDGRLRQWYIDMLKECQKRNICGRVTNMYDLYIDNESLDATCMPYLEGDYFPGEAENIIKELLEGGGKKGGSNGKRSKKKANKSKGRGVRVDDDGLCEDDDEVEKAYTEGGRDEVMIKLGETIFPMKESFIVAFLNWSGAKPENMVVPEDVLKYRREAEANGSAELERRQRLQDMQELKDQYGNAIKVIDDDDEDMDCEFFNNRQAFLNLCRGNHYQFDELRRAKHTSMMVLWHLHNRDAPKFVQQCACCNREILTGMRYHCNSCPDYDLCEECNRNPNANRGACIHKLQPIAVEVEKENQDSGSNGISQEARKERQRNLQLHIKLIEHASRCKAASCASNNCPKMKVYLHHAKTCTVKAAGGCKVCKRIWALLRIHAQKCKDSVCPVPQCMAIRERIRQLAKQQQAMDDRRRQEMNRAFRMGMPTSG